MSLADSANLCLSAILTQLAAVGCPEQEYKEIVQYTVLDAVRRGLKSKREVYLCVCLNQLRLSQKHAQSHTLMCPFCSPVYRM